MASNQSIRDYARRLYRRQGEQAFNVAQDMILHLEGMGDSKRANDWRSILAVIEEYHRDASAGGAISRRAGEPAPQC